MTSREAWRVQCFISIMQQVASTLIISSLFAYLRVEHYQAECIPLLQIDCKAQTMGFYRKLRLRWRREDKRHRHSQWLGAYARLPASRLQQIILQIYATDCLLNLVVYVNPGSRRRRSRLPDGVGVHHYDSPSHEVPLFFLDISGSNMEFYVWAQSASILIPKKTNGCGEVAEVIRGQSGWECQNGGRSAHDDFLSVLDCSLNQPQHGEAAFETGMSKSDETYRFSPSPPPSSSLPSTHASWKLAECAAVWPQAAVQRGFVADCADIEIGRERRKHWRAVNSLAKKINPTNLTVLTIKYLCLHLIMISE